MTTRTAPSPGRFSLIARRLPHLAALAFAATATGASGCALSFEIGGGDPDVADVIALADGLALRDLVVSDTDAANVAANTQDADLGTRWSSLGRGSFIQGDLGEARPIAGVMIAWYRGDVRTATFAVEVSDDGVAFQRVLAATSSGASLDPETYAFAAIDARHVRIVVDGNSDNEWASITELRAVAAGSSTPSPDAGPATDPTPPDTGTVIWNGDFSTGDLTQYTGAGGKVQYDKDVDKVVVVDDPILGGPAAGGRKALKITVHNTSQDPAQDSPKHRAQAESPKVIGLTDEVYIGYSLLLPADFPTTHKAGPVTWGGANLQQCSLWEVHGTPYGGSPPMGLRVRDSNAQQRLGFFQGNPANKLRSSQLLSSLDARGRWLDIVIHVKMSGSAATGFYEQWIDAGDGYKPTVFDDGSTRLKMATAIPSVNGGGKNFSKVSLYYNDNAFPKATVYFAGHKIGTTFASVDPGSYP